MPHADFVHLRVHTAYSLSEGAIKIKSLVKLCDKLAMPAVGLADSGNLFGALEFSVTCADAGIRIDALARRYKSHMIERINQRKLQHRQFNIILNEILCELSKCTADVFDDVLHTTVPQYDNVECVYVMDESGTQISSTICNHRLPRRKNGVMFRPAPKGADHSLKEYYYVLLDVELNKFTTEPYVSLATGNLCRTISTCFRDSQNNKLYILCIDVLCT